MVCRLCSRRYLAGKRYIEIKGVPEDCRQRLSEERLISLVDPSICR